MGSIIIYVFAVVGGARALDTGGRRHLAAVVYCVQAKRAAVAGGMWLRLPEDVGTVVLRLWEKVCCTKKSIGLRCVPQWATCILGAL